MNSMQETTGDIDPWAGATLPNEDDGAEETYYDSSGNPVDLEALYALGKGKAGGKGGGKGSNGERLCFNCQKPGHIAA